jgi:hypothetical protein
MIKILRLIICFYFLIQTQISVSQCLVPVNFVKQKDLPMPFPTIQLNMTAHRDTTASKPYLYISGKGAGLIIYNISSITSPTQVAVVPISSFGGLHIMSTTQSGNYLFVALGDHFPFSNQKSGLGIVDISNPSSPTVTATYSYTSISGAGQVCVEGNYAYLSAMQNGIIVLDVTNKSNIIFKSAFKPSVDFPKPGPNASEIAKINVRQIVAKNNVLYVCYDAGGVRVVNATNKTALVETGQYSNPVMLTRPRAYNNLVLNDSLVYVACDYAGMEVLNVKDTSNIIQTGWWNPWKADQAVNTWTNSPGHASEIEFDPLCKMVFMSCGRSDVMAVSVSNPTLPDSCARFGITTDSLGSWGIGRYQNQLYVSYIYASIPFYANWGGTKILTYNNACTTGILEYKKENDFTVFPNPASQELFVNSENESGTIELYNIIGQTVLLQTVLKGKTTIHIEKLITGSYFYKIRSANGSVIKTGKLIVAD